MPEKVEALFNDETEGIMAQLETHLEAMTDTIYGSFTLQEDALTDINDDINDRIQDMEFRLEKREFSGSWVYSFS